MSLATLTPSPGDHDDLDAFLAAVPAAADYDRDDDVPQSAYRPSKAAQRREGYEQINRQLGRRRHRRTERES